LYNNVVYVGLTFNQVCANLLVLMTNKSAIMNNYAFNFIDIRPQIDDGKSTSVNLLIEKLWLDVSWIL